MSSQPSLITVAADANVKRPGGTGIQRQFFRRPGAQGSGVYAAMDENGNVEIIGGPGVGPAGAMSVWTKIGDSNTFNVDSFYSFFNGTGSTTEANIQYKYNGFAITLGRFSIRVVTNTSATPVTFTVRVNGVDTPISITVPAGGTGIFENLVATAPVVAGNLVSIHETGVTVGVIIVSQTTAVAIQ